MQDVKIDRLFLAVAGRILLGMRKAVYQAPTVEELYALEKRARRERARYIAALVSSVYDRAVSALHAKVVRHA
jgi:hypothetical protein